MIAIFVPYEVKWRLLGITFGHSRGLAHFKLPIPISNVPSGILLDEPLRTVGRGIQLGLKIEAA